MKPVIELEGYRILEINYKLLTIDIQADDDTDNDDIFSPKFSFGLNEDSTRGQVIIEASVKSIESQREIFVSLEGQFKINKEELDNDDERVRDTLALNGSSILFPYVRSTISFVSTMDSQNALIIPTINVFQVLKKNNKK